MNPSTAIRRLARLAGEQPAIVADDRSWSFAELDWSVDALALALIAGGLRRGDRLAYLGHNSALFLQTLLASARIGAIFVPVNFRLTTTEVEQILLDADCGVAVAEDGQRGLAAELGLHCWFGSELELAQLPAGAGNSAAEDIGREDTGRDETAPDDIAIILYTSGTTGVPKGVVLTYANLWWNQVNVADALPGRPYAVTLAAAPLFHIGGLNAFVLGTLSRGGTVIVHRRFDPAACVRDIQRYRISSTFLVPTMFDALRRTEEWRRADLSSLTSAIVAGAPVPPGLVLACAADGLSLQQAWGLTETAPFACYLPPAYVRSHPDSAGFPMPYSEVAVRTADGRIVQAAEVEGELCVRGPQVTAGYWRDPAATAEAIDADGWFRTGDLGRLDAAGRCYVLDRIKDLIISGGENIAPAEVERVLADYPGVRDAAVVGVPDEQWGQAVVAVLVGAAPSPAELRAFAGGRLAGYKLPTRVLPVAAIPRNGSGKIDRAGVRALVWSVPNSGRNVPPAMTATNEG